MSDLEASGVRGIFSNRFVSIDVREGIAALTFVVERRMGIAPHPQEAVEVVCRLVLTRRATLALLDGLNQFREEAKRDARLRAGKLQ